MIWHSDSGRTARSGRRVRLFATTALAALALIGCGGGGGGSGTGGGGSGTVPTPPTPPPPPPPPPPPTGAVTTSAVATFDSPWAMVFLPDGRMLVTERPGRLRVVTEAGLVGPALSGVPAVQAAGQGGSLDVALDPQFATNNRVYLSYAEANPDGVGLAVARGVLAVDASGAGAVNDIRVIWRQFPKVAGDTRHYGGRMAFGADGFLYITAGDRHQGAPAQDTRGLLGKIVRIDTDGAVPSTNPFVGTAGRADIWSLGHRNPYGLVRAADGRLFSTEMGPEGGDEFNLITPATNYGWRVVSEGSDGGEVLPRHASRPEFAAPLVSWTPVIAPGGMIQYTGTRFIGWNGDFVLAGLVSQGLVRVRVSGATAAEQARIPLGRRIREVEQGPDGAIWVLEDGAGGRLLKLVPQ